MAGFTPIASLLGGLLIGLALALVLAVQGRVVGVSGIYGALLAPQPGDRAWRIAFCAGLLASGALAAHFAPQRVDVTGAPGLAGLIAAGLLVGFGTRLGNGCTSGHGVCGIARLSPRSLAATATFMGFGAAAVYVVRHLLGTAG